MSKDDKKQSIQPTRREFLATSGAVAGAAALGMDPGIAMRPNVIQREAGPSASPRVPTPAASIRIGIFCTTFRHRLRRPRPAFSTLTRT